MSDWYPGGAEWDECSLEPAHEQHGWGQKKYLGIRLLVSEVKRAIYEKDAGYFKEALLSRLKEGGDTGQSFQLAVHLRAHGDRRNNNIVV